MLHFSASEPGSFDDDAIELIAALSPIIARLCSEIVDSRLPVSADSPPRVSVVDREGRATALAPHEPASCVLQSTFQVFLRQFRLAEVRSVRGLWPAAEGWLAIDMQKTLGRRSRCGTDHPDRGAAPRCPVRSIAPRARHSAGRRARSFEPADRARSLHLHPYRHHSCRAAAPEDSATLASRSCRAGRATRPAHASAVIIRRRARSPAAASGRRSAAVRCL